MTHSVELTDIRKTFPGVVANDDVSLSVNKGEVHVILGENGAGKSTLMNILYGLYQPDGGTIRIDGEEKEFESPQDAINEGIGMIHQHFKLVGPMTITENIILGSEPKKSLGMSVDMETARREVKELSERYGFDINPEDAVEDVSVGVRQRVEILRALYRGADILILDEPTAVLTPDEIESLFVVFDELIEQGKTIIFITHKLDEVMSVADDISVLRDGKRITTIPAEEATNNRLAELMVGDEVLLELDRDPHPKGEELLRVDDLQIEGDDATLVDDVTLSVREGEVLGIAGVDGNGQTVLSDAIAGLIELDDGSVTFDGEDATEWGRNRLNDAGLSYIPPDRQEQGLVMNFDHGENVILGEQHTFPIGRRMRDDELAEEIVAEYDVKTSGVETSVKSLSGGNQQKLLVGRELERDPKLVIASNPTRGLDVGSIEFIHEQLLSARRNDRGVLLISSKLDELQQLSDRIAVIYEGEIIDTVDPETVTERELGLLMAGQELVTEETDSVSNENTLQAKRIEDENK
ncbi:ABC transporter ATP-binding protein [Natrialba swarupiae]|uniref:ABC transporter ATP-binding protein n=1 Tax=Natrialba swarupiae TaxID=2448032 RepID=A0A5D5AFI7_9EURY|nr:ABC transporter ATP-binding protein [Natrialba swarupiae]TYT60526.1 ABC transporter ATP-binding protein [Natrialba swarupiae]